MVPTKVIIAPAKVVPGVMKSTIVGNTMFVCELTLKDAYRMFGGLLLVSVEVMAGATYELPALQYVLHRLRTTCEPSENRMEGVHNQVFEILKSKLPSGDLTQESSFYGCQYRWRIGELRYTIFLTNETFCKHDPVKLAQDIYDSWCTSSEL